ncbi:hypothetical protein STEG23_003818 [Scotinomys teguina]
MDGRGKRCQSYNMLKTYSSLEMMFYADETVPEGDVLMASVINSGTAVNKNSVDRLPGDLSSFESSMDGIPIWFLNIGFSIHGAQPFTGPDMPKDQPQDEPTTLWIKTTQGLEDDEEDFPCTESTVFLVPAHSIVSPESLFGVGMEIPKKLSSKTREEVSMQLDLKASTSQENLTDHYSLLRTLRKGNFAEVKLARHLHMKVKVAIKALKNGKENEQKNKTEIDIVKMLDHPNIIRVFHIITTEEHTYIVMEHASRGDLVTHIKKWGHLQEEQAQHLFIQIACAVHYCHENGIAHRDIKLDNILLDGKGNIKLCDFGMAIRVISGQKSEGFCGTIEYCAPELFTGTDYDARAVDIWSMGVTLYAMVTGYFPFSATTYSDMKEMLRNPNYYIPPTLSRNIANLIVQLFTVMPEQRPKINNVRQHQWFKDREEFWKLPLSSETSSTMPNPSLVAVMSHMGYHPKDINDSLREKKFNNVMATYLILNHESAQDHTTYAVKSMPACVAMSLADALTSLAPQRSLSELILHNFDLIDEDQVHAEQGSLGKWSRSLSMPAILCLEQEEDDPAYPVDKCAPRVTYLKCRSLSLGSTNCKELFPRCALSEGNPALYLIPGVPQGVTNNVTQRSSLQIPSIGGTASSTSNLPRGWKRVKKLIGNCLKLLCCCVPASRRSYDAQRKVATDEVESSAVTHM